MSRIYIQTIYLYTILHKQSLNKLHFWVYLQINVRLFLTKSCLIIFLNDIFLNEGRIHKKLTGGQRRESLSINHKEAIKGYMESDCSITLREIKNKLHNQFDIEVSQKTIDRAIINFNWS